MPKIEVYEQSFFSCLGTRLSEEELLESLTVAKAELDGKDADQGILKIELNDTNRPDLWSSAGLARQLRVHKQKKLPQYDFFSRPGAAQAYEERTVIVDPRLKSIRPYITAFAVTGKPIGDAELKDIIQTQEKLCWNYGRKRKSIAMGVYRSDLIAYPVQYKAVSPDATSFVPLGFERSLTLKQILSEHPKGQEFGPIVKDFSLYPFITDAKGEVLSFPPVINSARIGAVEKGDSNLFIELTGTDLPPLTLTASIVACDLADSGYTILPVKVVYPYDTPFGREIVNPYYFQERITLDIGYAEKLLGEKLSPQEAADAVRSMGCPVTVEGNTLIVTPPEYRNDFLHPVDVVEDIMIGRGMGTFSPLMPRELTMGRLSDEEQYARKVQDIMVGLGFQEMIYNYLGSRKDFIEKMNITGEEVIRIANPMSENFEYVRNSILPCLLGTESVSGNAVYPHKVFEIGKVVRINPAENYGSVTVNSLGFLSADRDVGFNSINSQVSALFFYLAKEYEIAASDDPRFIRGRAANIVYKGKQAGIFGELHPALLTNWGIQMPCTAGEIDLDVLLN